MRRIRYSVSQILRTAMAAAGGVLILALAGTYEENRKAGAFPVLEEFERELRWDGLRALFRLAYPGAAEESRQEEGGTWSEKILWWLEGDVLSPINPKDECPFCSRCPYVKDVCRQAKPELKKVNEKHYVACHLL